MLPIIGREKEQALLREAYNSGKPEFIALYGRRRVGKTYLVQNTFKNNKETVFFYTTGTRDGEIADQIKNFTEAMAEAFWHPGASMEVKRGWRDTFRMLTDTMRASKKKKIVLFMDEFPWMVTRKSQLLQTLEYFWNHYWSNDPRIVLIICGSASGWILKNIVNNQGGLYNRVTRRIHLEPFGLYQTKRYLERANIALDHKAIVQLYMVLGGIPFYLDQLKPGLSAAQNIERLAFTKNSFLSQEFENLYATLFGKGNAHVELARVIAQKCYGIEQTDIAHVLKASEAGGTLIGKLEDLEQAGFIERIVPFGHNKRGIYYKMIDEYSLFYFHWIEPIKGSLLGKGMKVGYWRAIQQTSAWHGWAGCSFESLCSKHIQQIATALMLTPLALPYAWRYVPRNREGEDGAQIDLLFDREDRAITLCEIKFTDKPYALQKVTANALQKKADVFKKITRTRKKIFWALISAEGLSETLYSREIISAIVTLDDLFAQEESW